MDELDQVPVARDDLDPIRTVRRQAESTDRVLGLPVERLGLPHPGEVERLAEELELLGEAVGIGRPVGLVAREDVGPSDRAPVVVVDVDNLVGPTRDEEPGYPVEVAVHGTHRSAVA